MKKITAIVPDNIKPELLAGLVSVAIDLKIEQLNKTEPKVIRHRVPGKTATSAIMEHFSASAIFTKTQAASWLMALGYEENTAGGALSILHKEGYIRQLGSGKYQFLKEYPKIKLVS